MKKACLVLAALLVVCLSVDRAWAQRGRRGRGRGGRLAVAKGWFFDYGEAQALARRTGKPMMLVFRCVP